jgi:hypothetical protein
MTDYTPPTANEIRALMRGLSLTGADAARLVGAQSSRTPRRWTAGDALVPFGVLYALIHRASGISVTPAEWRAEAAEILDRGAALAKTRAGTD